MYSIKKCMNGRIEVNGLKGVEEDSLIYNLTLSIDFMQNKKQHNVKFTKVPLYLYFNNLDLVVKYIEYKLNTLHEEGHEFINGENIEFQI